MRLKLAARKSDLARLQAYTVAQKLKALHSDLDIEFQFRESLGDRNLTDPLWRMPEKGVFTEDFAKDLESGASDAVVHSYKDLPTEARVHTTLLAVLEREDPRDLLIIKKSALNFILESKSMNVFSSSPRREFNIGHFLKSGALPVTLQSTSFESVRGNIPTRVRKLIESESVQALVVAVAALNRLLQAREPEFSSVVVELREMLDQCHLMVLPISLNPTAPAQGALAVEFNRSRSDLAELFNGIANTTLNSDVQLERDELAKLGGGCHQKLGATALTGPWGHIFFVRGEGQERREFRPQLFKQTSQPFGDAKFFISSDSAVVAQRSPSLGAQMPQSGQGLFVSKADALPLSIQSWQGPIWTAGLKSWMALSRRGFWISGSYEGFGESNSHLPRELWGEQIGWTKLTHTGGQSVEGMKLCTTYELNLSPPNFADLSQATHFYWTSPSKIRSAAAASPQLFASGFHGCGPGSTLTELVKHQPKSYGVFLNSDDFCNYFRKKTK
jgi:hydroxymethylbilane synthase